MPPSIRLFHPDAVPSSSAPTSAAQQRTAANQHDGSPVLNGACSVQTVSVRLGDLLPILTQAVRERRGWIADFYDDTIEIPQDLYEVVLAYQEIASNQQRRAA